MEAHAVVARSVHLGPILPTKDAHFVRPPREAVQYVVGVRRVELRAREFSLSIWRDMGDY
jgi:hypothetical protein